MSWIEKLYRTYENCMRAKGIDTLGLLPICHSTQQAHLEIVLDDKGCFRRARVLDKDESETLIPTTEASAGRSGIKPPPHPLCDKLQYIAGDFAELGGVVTKGFLGNPKEPFEQYVRLLRDWASFDAQPKVRAILSYVETGQVIQDLIEHGLLPAEEKQRRTAKKDWNKAYGDVPRPEIYSLLQPNNTPMDVFVRWRVESPGSVASGTWEDQSLIESWARFYASQSERSGLCMVTGKKHSLSEQHPAKIRHAADKAKLISTNDISGFTFRGRFIDKEGEQACTVGFEVSQKAHSALRWLIQRQGYRNGDQVFVAWSVGMKKIPDPFEDTFDMLAGIDNGSQKSDPENGIDVGDVGQRFARQWNHALAGYRASLNVTEDIVVMGLDSATPGRMSIIFYRELRGSEFLDRVEHWHLAYAWSQNYSKDKKFIGAPAPGDIAVASYGRQLDDKLHKATVERLVPCIIDGQAVPVDIECSLVRRASNYAGMEHWEWEKSVGIACAIYRGNHQERGYDMALEENRTTRDYLYGRLLAVADAIERYAMSDAEKKRPTAAMRLMQRFADRPFSTWRTIETSLAPYLMRLQSSGKGGYHQSLLDSIMANFVGEEFANDEPLTGEFLLGFHCQRASFWSGKNSNDYVSRPG